MAREKKTNNTKKSQTQQQEEENPETQERKRLKKLAHRNNLLSETPAKNFTPLIPSKTVIKHHGTDILKKSQRKNRYLFSFSGLLAPISGGKIGQLADLGSKNPILYLDFPMGRMKLFGTIVFPKNRYLTLQFSRGGKNVVCEDCFDTMIVFSDAFWIGKKEENPDEARLEFPKELQEEKHTEFDFKGGAGATAVRNKDAKKVVTKSTEEESLSESLADEVEAESPKRNQNTKDVENITPVRQSGRTTGKTFNFAEVSSGDDSAESVSDVSGEVNEETSKKFTSLLVDQNPGNLENLKELHSSEDTTQETLPSLVASETKVSSRNKFVQSTISTLFKKVEEKSASGSSRKMSSCKVSGEKVQLNSSKRNIKQIKDADLKKVEIVSQDKNAEARDDRKKRKAELIEVEDDIEECSSASEEIDESDDDWHA